MALEKISTPPEPKKVAPAKPAVPPKKPEKPKPAAKVAGLKGKSQNNNGVKGSPRDKERKADKYNQQFKDPELILTSRPNAHSESLEASVVPVLYDLRKIYDDETSDNVKGAFDYAERLSPGIVDEFSSTLVRRLVGSVLSFESVNAAIEKLHGY